MHSLFALLNVCDVPAWLPRRHMNILHIQALLYHVVLSFKDQSPLEVYGTEFFVDGPQLGFLGKTFELLLVLPQAIKLEKSRGTTELKDFCRWKFESKFYTFLDALTTIPPIGSLSSAEVILLLFSDRSGYVCVLFSLCLVSFQFQIMIWTWLCIVISLKVSSELKACNCLLFHNS